jgi:transcriptional antiterminator RfaH
MNIIWYVAHTQPSKEIIAKQYLLDQVYEVYVPKFNKIRRYVRKVQQKFFSLFQRYIFMRLDLYSAKSRGINETRVVYHLLMSNNLYPAKAATSIIDKLPTQEIDDGIFPIESLINFIKGDKSQFLDDGFAEQPAIFESVDDNSRFQLLLNFMGREVKIPSSTYAVKTA